MIYLKRFFILVIVVVVLLVVWVMISPKPFSLLVRKMFDGGVAVAPNNYAEILDRVSVSDDLEYQSNAGRNTYKLFTPNNGSKDLPTVLWVHGGAFVGGDKQDIYEYAVQLADRGFNVITMNYMRAPEAHYPSQINQISQMISTIQNDLSDRVSLDTLVLAGDSAGAHMVTQFTLIQNNPEYAKEVGINPILEQGSIDGTLLLCGPYDIDQLIKRADESKVMDFFATQIAWSYLGEKDWRNMEGIEALSVLNYIDNRFPPSFITDGNKGSFTDHGLALASKLESFGVKFSTAFYDLEEAELEHEYQFKMDLPQSINTFETMVSFLKNLNN